MSDDAIMASVQTDTSLAKTRWPRYALYAVGAFLVVIALAYIDGGEEPLHPIAQTVSPAFQSEVRP